MKDWYPIPLADLKKYRFHYNPSTEVSSAAEPEFIEPYLFKDLPFLRAVYNGEAKNVLYPRGDLQPRLEDGQRLAPTDADGRPNNAPAGRLAAGSTSAGAASTGGRLPPALECAGAPTAQHVDGGAGGGHGAGRAGLLRADGQENDGQAAGGHVLAAECPAVR